MLIERGRNSRFPRRASVRTLGAVDLADGRAVFFDLITVEISIYVLGRFRSEPPRLSTEGITDKFSHAHN